MTGSNLLAHSVHAVPGVEFLLGNIMYHYTHAVMFVLLTCRFYTYFLCFCNIKLQLILRLIRAIIYLNCFDHFFLIKNNLSGFCSHFCRFIMGIKFSRRRDVPISGAEGAATEQKTAEEPVATEPVGELGPALAQEATGIVRLEAVDREKPKPVASLPNEECVAEIKEEKAPDAPEPLNVAEPEPVAKNAPAPSQAQPEVLLCVDPPPLIQCDVEPTPVTVTQPAPEPIPEPAPETIPEPQSVPELETAIPDLPPDVLEQHTDMLNQEILPDPVIPSSTLIDLSVSDTTPDKTSDIAVSDECQEGAEVSGTSTTELPKSEEMSESPERPTEVVAAENLEQIVSDVNEETVSGLLQDLALKGNDLVADLIPTDVKMPDETSITDMST